MDRAGPPDGGQIELAITFFYYKDVMAAAKFWEEVLGLTLTIDQGWSRIYRVAGGGMVGLVDEARGMHRSHPVKPVQFCIRVPDADAWHSWVSGFKPANLTAPKSVPALGIRVFVFDDPEGYQIEVQSVLSA
jgi:predicted enzyme related to lactoylglutathione lyase